MNNEKDENLTMKEANGMETGIAVIEAAGAAERKEAGSWGAPSGAAGSGRYEATGTEAKDSAAPDVDRDGAAELRAALTRAEERVTQLERERALLAQGVSEEDLDYYVFKIGKLVTGEKDFDTAAKEFLKQQAAARRASAPRSTGASLTGQALKPRSTNDTMNRILRGN